jgi:hypothetical protein
LELSSAVGFTFNGENPDTDYTAKIPVSTQWSWFHEFGVENRATGDVGMLTVSVPLSAAGH